MAKKRKLLVPENADEMLNLLQKYFRAPEKFRTQSARSRFYIDRARVWLVLTALRGPDQKDPSLDVKKSITAVIRWKFLGCNDGNGMYGFANPDSVTKARFRTTMDLAADTYYHFLGHSQSAFARLGMTWDKVNRSVDGKK